MKKIRVNLGCGDKNPPQWINVDYSLGAKFSKLPIFPIINSKLKLFNVNWSPHILIHDLRTKFPWEDNSIDTIYSSHTLEHFDKSDGKHFLKECYRVLKGNGIIRIIVPDLKFIVSEYTHGSLSADDFVDRLEVSSKVNKGGFFNKITEPFLKFPHLCMYDNEALIRILSDIGFICNERNPFDSDIEDIKTIEHENRTKHSVIIEGKK